MALSNNDNHVVKTIGITFIMTNTNSLCFYTLSTYMYMFNVLSIFIISSINLLIKIPTMHIWKPVSYHYHRFNIHSSFIFLILILILSSTLFIQTHTMNKLPSSPHNKEYLPFHCNFSFKAVV